MVAKYLFTSIKKVSKYLKKKLGKHLFFMLILTKS